MNYKITLFTLAIVFSINITLANSSNGISVYTSRPDDEQAVYLIAPEFNVKADGVTDDADALQKAIDKVEARSKFGIVFIPEGKYRLGKTVYVWKGIRLIGYGGKRPVFILAKNTPGFQDGNEKYMIHFVSDKPHEGEKIRDANPGTFYSAISNINFEIKNGNPSAVAVRSHFAQHCFLSHIDFNIGTAKAGIDKVGNEIDDCRFFGGQYGIITTKPSPSWPFLMTDSYFEGQQMAAIQTEEGGLTLVRVIFENVPAAIEINPDRAEELWLTDSRFKNIPGPAIIISDEFNARPQINIRNLVCEHVPFLASFRTSRKQISVKHKYYLVKDFCHGLQIDELGAKPEVKTTSDIVPLDKLPESAASDIPALPSSSGWVNIKSLGAKGDGVTDDTRTILDAIEKHQNIYLPSGRYRVTNTIALKTNTVLIGLNPITTQIILKDSTEKYQGYGTPVALLETPKGGTNIVAGIGLDAGGINPRAVAAKWMAGTNSLMNDVRFIGGHGTYNADGTYVKIYNSNRTGDDNRNRKWDSQYWSLWITDGGGGTFKNIWTPSPFAQAGIRVSNTSTEGRIYAISIEHHVRNEVIFDNVSNWKIYDIQMEEESGESWNALPLEINNCSNLIFANLYLYRVDRMVSPFPSGVLIRNSKELEFRGIHVYSPTKFSYSNTLFDQTQDAIVRSREIARLKISGSKVLNNTEESKIMASGAKIEKIVGGFEFIDGLAVDSKGEVYFLESRWNKIYKWSVEEKQLSLVSNLPISPLALAFDSQDNLLVSVFKASPNPWIKPHGYTILAMKPDNVENTLHELTVDSTLPVNTIAAIHPGHRWKDEHDFLKVTIEPFKAYYTAPDQQTIIPAYDDLKRAYSLRKAIPGNIFYIADEFGQKTVAFNVNNNGSLSNPKLFAEEGELDVIEDSEGNVYIAAGNIFVYDKNGKYIETIQLPERPSTMVFGGKEKDVLYVTGVSSLYAIQTKFKGK